MDTRIAILTSHSLLADGLVSCLKEFSSQLKVQVFDVTQADVLSEVFGFQPLAIILEKERSQQYETCSLQHILATFPNITVIYLHMDDSEVQVILSEQHIANGVRDLIEIIHPSGTQANLPLAD